MTIVKHNQIFKEETPWKSMGGGGAANLKSGEGHRVFVVLKDHQGVGLSVVVGHVHVVPLSIHPHQPIVTVV